MQGQESETQPEEGRRGIDIERLQAIVGGLEREALARVGRRTEVEARWLRNLRQYHGVYDDDIAQALADDTTKSTLFINQTRPKTNTCAAKLSDMLFPTDDKNWGVKETPVPQLVDTASRAPQAAVAAAERANQMVQAGQGAEAEQVVGQANAGLEAGDAAKADLETAKQAAKSMEKEIEDQLRQCQYNVAAREVIEDACKLGTGIMKGPVDDDRVRRVWRPVDEGGRAMHVMQTVNDPRPGFLRVDPWHWFPDMDALVPMDSESFFERHLLSKPDLRRLARRPDFDSDAIRRLLRSEPSSVSPTFLADLRSITGKHNDTGVKRYVAWEYRGPLTADDAREVAMLVGGDDMIDEEVDPLDEINVVVWFCQGEVLKFGIHHLDSGDPIYSVFCIERDDSSLFGIGVPELMRDSQSAMNGAWRMMMDNGGLSTGPQIEVDLAVVEPADGEYALAPRKLWLRKSTADPNKPGIRTYDIPSHQAELAGIIELSKMFVDDETGVSMLAQGEQGSHVTQTLGGMSILMNATNIVFRRIVKNFDDDMTVPNIRRLYDWNMQFSSRDEIKGDMDVDARGTSVLLVREMQSQTLMALLMNFGGHPVIGPLLKVAPTLRRLVQSFMLSADEIVLTDEELRQAAESAQAEPDPEADKLALQLEIAKIESQTRLQVADLQRETALVSLAHQSNMKLEELRQQLDITRLKLGSDERKMATEVAFEARRDEANRAQADRHKTEEVKAKGSGGYV